MVRRPDTESENSSQAIDERPIVGDSTRQLQSRLDVHESDQDSVEHEVGEVDQKEQVADGTDNEGDSGDTNAVSSKGTKRARVNADGEAVSIKEERRPRRPNVLHRDSDGFVAGSIVRVKLHNFLTYDDVEFRPGPYLNMVLGPNGTGKSSIACALCLGLNWPPSILGRATKIGSFVKIGKQDGSIEIELKGPIGEPNLVIRRQLASSMSTQQSFTLNGTQTSGKEISARVEALGIQVNNLCSFLPQDKVAEFAHLTPQQLLRATQRAAGDEQLVEWHDTLMSTSKDLRDVTSSWATEQKEVENLVQKNATLEKEVTAYKNRRQIERQIELFEVILPCKEYYDARKEYEALKLRRDDLHRKAEALQARNRPVLEFKDTLVEERDAARAERKKYEDVAKKKNTSMKALWKRNEDLQTESEKITDDLTHFKNQEKKRRNNIQALKDGIHKLEHELAHPPEIEDMETINADFKANDVELNAEEFSKYDLEGKITQHANQSREYTKQLENLHKELKNLDDASQRKLSEFSARDPDSARAVQWLRTNKDKFRMDVFEPAALSVEVKDPRYSAAVEAGFNPTQLRTFVFQCEDDMAKFNRLLVDSGETLGAKLKVATWFRPKVDSRLMREPMNQEELSQRGFDAYALDLLTYPEGMEWFLKDEIKLHRFAIGLDSQKVDMKSAMDAVSREIDGKPGAGNFVSGTVLSQVTRSRYGKKEAFNNTRDIGRPRYFRTAPIDQEKKKRLQDSVMQVNAQKAEEDRAITRFNDEMREIESRIRKIQADRAKVEERRKVILAAQKRLTTVRFRLDEKQKQLHKEENAPSIEEKRAQLRKKGFNYAKERLGIARQLKDITRSIIEDVDNADIVGLRALQLTANVDALVKLLETHDAEVQAAIQDANAITQEFNEMKKTTKEKLNASKVKLAEIDEEMKQTFSEMSNSGEVERMDADDIKQDLANLRAQLELNLATNAGVIEQYEHRQRQIEQRTRALENKEKRKTDFERKLLKTRSKWYPALQELVSSINDKFSTAFDRVNCAGEIRIGEHPDDYSQWTIDILVKFRDNENLQLLTGQRQSGGERALTTIMYLMSLTELARSPFSLVDEINQGMDAHYERAVHNSLVEVTCQPDSGQYFLITPKLLTDLKYHERMKVLCVSNGEWLPEEQTSGNMMRMIEAFAARTVRAQ